MIPPKGFKRELFPLRHEFSYSCGLNLGTTTINSTMLTIVKNYKGVNDPNTIVVNPKDGDFETESGAICAPMSIIDKLQYFLEFTLTEDALADGVETVRVSYMPVWTSFANRLAEADMKTTTTVKALLGWTSDATQEDITPAFATKLSTGAAANERVHPTSSANFTEVFGTLNLTTNTAMEGLVYDSPKIMRAIKYYTNSGALKSCIGRLKHFTLTKNRPTARVFRKGFPPRDVRRIQPYSYFGMIVNLPLDSEMMAHYYTGAQTADKVAVGVKLTIKYDEWSPDHIQEVTA